MKKYNNSDCIFCKIIAGTIPSKKVYEDKFVLAFSPIEQISKGHTLIIPKKHYKDIFDIDEKELAKVMIATKKIASATESALGAKGINILHASRPQAQQSVFHFHIHLVPRYANDGLDTWPKSNYKESNIEDINSKIRKTLI
jgi:histidine triad (HIT) family protein